MIRNIDDITRDREEQERKKFKDNVSEDIEDLMNTFLKTFKKEKKVKKKSKIMTIIKIGFGILGTLILINIFLGNLWLIKFFIENIF